MDNFTEFEYATKWNMTTASGAEMVIPPSCCKLKNEDAYYKAPKDAKLEDENCPVSPTDGNSYMTKVWNLSVILSYKHKAPDLS